MIGSAETLARARNGMFAQETLPKGGTAVWRRFMRHLKEKGLIMAV